MNVIFLVYGGSQTTPLFSSESIEKCLAYMRDGGLCSIQCYTIRAMEMDTK